MGSSFRPYSNIAQKLYKKKSDIIRDAKSLEESKKNRLQNAIKKTTNSDFSEYREMEDSLYDGL